METYVEPYRRSGSGTPMVCLHGFADSWQTWDLVLPALTTHHDVLIPMLPGHLGGGPISADAGPDVLVDAVERAMDQVGFTSAHIVGNSLGAYVALQLAERGRADSVVALAPAGGWPMGDPSYAETIRVFRQMRRQLRVAAPLARVIVATAVGRRLALRMISEQHQHIPADMIVEMIRAAHACTAAEPLLERADSHRWDLDAAAISCPVRVVWGTDDQLLIWPIAAQRYRDDLLPDADWIVLDGAGHALQLDQPTTIAQLILDFTAGVAAPLPTSVIGPS